MPFGVVNGQILSIVRSGERWYTSITIGGQRNAKFSPPRSAEGIPLSGSVLRLFLPESLQLSSTEPFIGEVIDAPIDGRYHDAESDRRERHRSVLWRMVRGGLGAGHLCQG